MQAFKYFTFAIICTIINLGTQFLILEGINQNKYDHDTMVLSAMFCGTFAGLLSKFFLDKFYVFMDPRENLNTELSKFFIYSSMGVITTAIFWLTEWCFYITWKNPAAKYIGGLLGLSLGYCLKYILDQRFVFNQASSR
ncbi:MAG: GtrA family protein [bacterium]|nr:GtrA family protein [bacterium]